MLRIENHGDVTRVELSSWTGRRLGYSVSVYKAGDLLIDTGFPRAAAELAAWVDRAGVRGAILTHWHEDHAGGAATLARRGLPIDMDPATERQLRAPPRLQLYRRATWGSFTPLEAALVPLAPNAVDVIAAPGHSPDHRVVWLPETRTLFAGDLFLGGKVRLAHDGEDFATLIESLRRCAALDPARMFCGHRGLVPDAAAALRAKADWLQGMIAAIGERAAAGWSDERIVRGVLGGEELAGVVSRGYYSRAAFVRVAKRASVARAGMP